MKIVAMAKSAWAFARRRPMWAAVAAIALAVAAVWSIRYVEKPLPPTAYYEVKRGDFTVSVVEGGTLEAVNEVSIRNEVEGVARIIYLVPEGTLVKKGDLLVELDSSQAQDQYDQQLLNVQKAQFALVQAEQQLAIQKSQADSDIRAAELSLKFAQMDLDKFLKAESITSLLEASNNVANIEAKLAVDMNSYEWSKKLAAKGYETKRTVDSDELTVRSDKYQLLISSNKLWMLQNFDLEKQREQLTSNVEEAKRELERVKQKAARTVAQYEADVLTQSNALALQQKFLDRYRKNLEACKVYAPQDGLVVYPVNENRWSSESMIEEGATVRNRQELIKLPDTSQMKVKIRVHESVINMVKVGQQARVVLDSMPDRTFQGRVNKVGLLPDSLSRWANPNLKVYTTEVLITEKLPQTVKPGVSAQAEIIVTNIPQTLYVPIQAVTTYRGRPAVYVLRGGKPSPSPVEVGMFNTQFIQILSGVKEGDRVLLSPPFDIEQRDIESGGVLAAESPGKEPSKSKTQKAQAAPSPTGRTPGSRRTGRGAANAGPAAAGEKTPAAARARPQPGNRPAFDPKALMRRFDKNGNGQLDAQEREAMRAALKRQFGGGRARPGGPKTPSPRARPNGSGRPARP
ncbi:MAG: efflux RND transporter periplasmic adaptor subunit [Verrucomicrobia bacterium]|nr:efflux RND transporter periplasmic adaptor subunit [Verrucomicrobiota bacterium]